MTFTYRKEVKVLIEDEVLRKAKNIRQAVLENQVLAKHIDEKRKCIPAPKIGKGMIKLIIIGQDPTVKNKNSRDSITTTLNLDKRNSLYTYVSYLAEQTGCDLEQNVYATNLLKCFFIAPPASIKNEHVVRKHTPFWIDLLNEELNAYPNATVITMGEPLLNALVVRGSHKVKEYWGYQGKNLADIKSFRYCDATSNLLQRKFFPFPHQPSIRIEFYKKYMNDYLIFMNQINYCKSTLG